MKTNVGSIDRTLRIIAGLVILAAGFYFQNWFGLIGLIPLGTALMGWCPAYLPFGISTCKKK
jgi:type IV secretory pathway TrbD component